MLNPRGGLSERLAGSSNLIVEAFSNYRVRIPWLGLTLRFRDRVGEASKLVNPPYIANPMMILYGPLGCGKSEIARALLYGAETSRGRGSTVEILILTALEAEGGVLSIEYTQGFKEYVESTLKGRGFEYSVHIGGSVGLPGVASLSVGLTIEPGQVESVRLPLLWSIIDKLVSNPGEGRDYIVFLDEFRGVSEGSLKSFVEKTADTIGRMHSNIMDRGNSSISMIVSTSDSMAAYHVGPYSPKYLKVYMWNLPFNAFKEVVEELGGLGALGGLDEASRRLGVSVADLSWRLFGGNVRELLLAGTLGLEGWVRRAVANVTAALAKTVRDRRLSESEVVSEVKNIGEKGAEALSTSPLYDEMLRRNIAIDLVGALGISDTHREKWVSEGSSFQLPIYYHVVRAMASRRSLHVEPGDVMRMVLGVE
jgi:hypothetical protein